MDPADEERERRLAEQAASREAMQRAARLRADKNAIAQLAAELRPNNAWRSKLIAVGLAVAAAASTYVAKDWIEGLSQQATLEAQVGTNTEDIEEIEEEVRGLRSEVGIIRSGMDKLLGKFGLD